MPIVGAIILIIILPFIYKFCYKTIYEYTKECIEGIKEDLAYIKKAKRMLKESGR